MSADSLDLNKEKASTSTAINLDERMRLAEKLNKSISQLQNNKLTLFWVKGIVHTKKKMLSSLTYVHIALNLYEFLCSVEHIRRYCENQTSLELHEDGKLITEYWCLGELFLKAYAMVQWVHSKLS